MSAARFALGRFALGVPRAVAYKEQEVVVSHVEVLEEHEVPNSMFDHYTKADDMLAALEASLSDLTNAMSEKPSDAGFWLPNTADKQKINETVLKTREERKQQEKERKAVSAMRSILKTQYSQPQAKPQQGALSTTPTAAAAAQDQRSAEQRKAARMESRAMRAKQVAPAVPASTAPPATAARPAAAAPQAVPTAAMSPAAVAAPAVTAPVTNNRGGLASTSAAAPSPIPSVAAAASLVLFSSVPLPSWWFLLTISWWQQH